eukprot:scaffold4453_cov65-Phaeocystis_antarctica.AAC.2
MLATCAAILRGPATQPRLLRSGCWLSHSDWGWLGWSVARVELGRLRGSNPNPNPNQVGSPSGAPSPSVPEANTLRLLTRARPSMVYLCSSPSGQSESDA